MGPPRSGHHGSGHHRSGHHGSGPGYPPSPSPQKWSSWNLTRVPPGSGHHGSGHHRSGHHGSGSRVTPSPPEVVIMEVDQGTPPEVVITEVVIMEVDQGTPPPQKWSSWKLTRVPPLQKWSSWKWTRVPPPPPPSGQTTHRPSAVGFPLKKGFLLVFQMILNLIILNLTLSDWNRLVEFVLQNNEFFICEFTFSPYVLAISV